METFTREELSIIGLSLKNNETFPSLNSLIREIVCGVGFNTIELQNIDTDTLADSLETKLNQLKEENPAMFQRFYLAMQKLWESKENITNYELKLKEVGLLS
ncbi:hypothetical protein [Iningainema tapete]|uniref:Uncharacterized protein n=1 Tax=Iningainema tapete BLCC-T55 TaxID=2748662 RepID=A0A8J6XNB0_9CYAN|nr:hypothetical protein [Iningainema tapete]MBD2778223.1 hypothetical protein [Iningainema tapete BLCC-T55]